MPDAIDVRPGRWANITVLYDDGQYSAIYGDFTAVGQPTYPNLGTRWNGSPGTAGYPQYAGKPQWYVEPEFLVISILHGLKQKLTAQPPSHQHTHYLQAIEQVLAEHAP